MWNSWKKNVIIDGISDRWDIDEYLKDIEDVWGYIAFENNLKIDSGKFYYLNTACEDGMPRAKLQNDLLHWKVVKLLQLHSKTWGLFVVNLLRRH